MNFREYRLKLAASFRRRRAIAKLQRLVEQSRNSPATRSFVKHRDAALKATRP